MGEGVTFNDIERQVERDLPLQSQSPDLTFSLGTARKQRSVGSPKRKTRKDRRSNGHARHAAAAGISSPARSPGTTSCDTIATSPTAGSVSGRASERLNRMSVAISAMSPLSYLRNKKRRTKIAKSPETPVSPTASYLPGSYAIASLNKTATRNKRSRDKTDNESVELTTPSPTQVPSVDVSSPMTPTATTSLASPQRTSKTVVHSKRASNNGVVRGKSSSKGTPVQSNVTKTTPPSTSPNPSSGIGQGKPSSNNATPTKTNKYTQDNKTVSTDQSPEEDTTSTPSAKAGVVRDTQIQATNEYINEQTPLLSTGSEETAPDSLYQTDSSQFTMPQDTKEKSNKWAAVKKHIDQGDLLLYHSFERDDDFNPRRKSRIQRAINEIQSGIQFSSSQCIIAIGLYLTIAIVCYSFIFEPGWSIVDSCYFAVVTFTTVGYGTIAPSTEASMIFTCFYALVGVACLGIALGILGSNLVEAQEHAVHMAEKITKYEVLSTFDTESSSSTTTSSSPTDDEGGIVSFLKNIQDGSQIGEEDVKAKQAELKFHHLRKIFLLVTLLVCMTSLAALIGSESGWDLIETVYYLIITACTIGYGDYAPSSQSEKVLAIFFIPIAVVAMGQCLGIIADFIIEGRSAKFRRKFRQREMTIRDLEIMDVDGSGAVTRAEFMEFMLLAMNKIDQDLVKELHSHFDRWNESHSGELCRQDLVEAARRKMKSPKHKLQLAAYKKYLLTTSVTKTTTDDDTRRSRWW